MPKGLVQLRDRPLYSWAVSAFVDHPGISEIVLVVPADNVEAVTAGMSRSATRVTVVAGGPTRQRSVAEGLAALDAGVELVLVHDAARPLVGDEVIDRVLTALHAGAQAVIPVLPVVDTIKQVDAHGVVVASPDRSLLRSVQTPQGFRLEALHDAHRRFTGDPDLITDDAGLMEAQGVDVATVEGSPRSFKITTRHDLDLARALAADGELR